MKLRRIARILLPLCLCLALLFSGCAAGKDPAGEPTDAPTASEAGAEAAADALPAFTVYDKDGNAVESGTLTGTPTVINFWATWCPPCRAELPDFQAAFEARGDVRFVMVDLTDGETETEAAVNAFLEENGYTFPVYFDKSGSAAVAMEINAIPMTVFLTADGRVARLINSMLSAEELEEGLALIAP